MTKTNQKLIEQLKKEYYSLMKHGLDIQQKGDINAYMQNAIRAENVAQRMQAISRQSV